jgi:hypothetical protein
VRPEPLFVLAAQPLHKDLRAFLQFGMIFAFLGTARLSQRGEQIAALNFVSNELGEKSVAAVFTD